MNTKIGIWGFGVVGKSALSYFVAKGATVQVLDQRILSPQEKELLISNNIPFYNHEYLSQFLEYNDYILPSCGIDLKPYDSWNHKWLSELDLFWEECKKPIIAITGSVGKTTITHILSQLLQKQSLSIFTGGNIGVGLLESIEQANAADYIVLEVSSFQLERCRQFTPFLFIITNIFPNHIDRHGSFDEYANAKLKVLSYQTKNTIALLPVSLFPLVQNRRLKGRLAFFSSSCDSSFSHEFYEYFFLQNLEIFKSYQTNTFLITSFYNIPDNLYLENLLIIVAIMDIIGLPKNGILSYLAQIIIPEHRMEKVAQVNAITFYNDSKSTIVQSTLAAIKKINNKPIILFLGGISKGVDRSPLIDQIKNEVRFVYCFGAEANQLKAFCDNFALANLKCTTLEEAFLDLPQRLKDGDQVLFSPAGASYDLYSNYRERGNCFKKLVYMLMEDMKSKNYMPLNFELHDNTKKTA